MGASVWFRPTVVFHLKEANGTNAIISGAVRSAASRTRTPVAAMERQLWLA